jgi:hypothetical protein
MGSYTVTVFEPNSPFSEPTWRIICHFFRLPMTGFSRPWPTPASTTDWTQSGDRVSINLNRKTMFTYF